MSRKTAFLFVLALLAASAAFHSDCISGPIFEERGALTVGLQGQYGLLTGDSDITDEFDRGPGYALRLRYYLGSDRAFGVSMESQRFDGVPDPALQYQPREMNAAIITLDYFLYFDRQSALSRYVTFGAGVHHPSREYDDGTEAGPDGLVLMGGAGLEFFFHRVASLDVSVRGYGLFGQGGLLGSGEAAVGFNFYVID